MHQEVQENENAKPTREDSLIYEKNRLLGIYRNAVIWSCKVLDYKRRFEREEDFEPDGLDEHVDFLKEDSRRELRDVSLHIKSLRRRISDINDELMDIAKERNEWNKKNQKAI